MLLQQFVTITSSTFTNSRYCLFVRLLVDFDKINEYVPEPLRAYGIWKYLTYQSLLIQLANAILHVGSSLSDSLVKPRDTLFTTLAFPVGNICVLTFWAVWMMVGRESIFPEEYDQYYPMWLNHATHTILLPSNLLFALVVNHQYIDKGVSITLGYISSYVSFLNILKFKTGFFVYKYLDTMNYVELSIYFSASAILVYIMYYIGQFLTRLVHPSSKKTLQDDQNVAMSRIV